MTNDELEPMTGRYDWDEAFRQGAERGLPAYEVPDEVRGRIW